ncbi:Rhodanese-related sulfurtransferase [Tissierella praeacuta DSM 18095]|uniref:Rhodanese-related sulfurtransferase n=1 Tax=Tissierella praeacuta DSM 18095 TaxID=1123404 RepID=A0A1M4S610_9FIRM|nr:rhodanese-like domain-containing protein [Tissierella praeacuta]SHE27638.1 Rhodanese-related sulfurtransferase [Tissierella praeacuta DSM 18095]SUP00944.1 Thiosulfate sulfurtransferase PspE precursor [Tissierella praeacuta]
MNNKKFKLFTLLVIIILTMSLMVACGKNNTQSADKSGDNSTDIATIKTMTGEELVKQNSGKEKDKVLIIDVRSPEEYKAGHIQHAINMNIEGFEDRIGELEDLKDFPIITYCNSGKKSGQVAEILVNKGFKDVTNAAGVKEFEYDLVHYDDLRGATFQKLIDENKDMILVDVRPEKQVAQEGMIEGAINIPFDAVESNLDKLPKDKTIALYCNTGTKSAEVAKQLEDIGYENIVNAIEGVKEFPFVLVK